MLLEKSQKSVEILQPFCEETIKKIEILAQGIFQNSEIKIEVYGSVATGLALPSSDLDLAVYGLQLESKSALVDALVQLQTGLSSLEAMEESEAIVTARIPLIKAKMRNGLKVDISIESQYLPLQIPLRKCTERVQEYSNVLPHFRATVLALKWLLQNANLNKPYLGGLGSFPLSLMISAFLRMCPTLPTPAETLIETLRYFGTEFKPSQMMVMHGNFIILLPPNYNPYGRPIISDPFINSNVSFNVTHFEDIQECFRASHDQLVKHKDCEAFFADLLQASSAVFQF